MLAIRSHGQYHGTRQCRCSLLSVSGQNVVMQVRTPWTQRYRQRHFPPGTVLIMTDVGSTDLRDVSQGNVVLSSVQTFEILQKNCIECRNEVETSEPVCAGKSEQRDYWRLILVRSHSSGKYP